jgi:hypothetical protein
MRCHEGDVDREGTWVANWSFSACRGDVSADETPTASRPQAWNGRDRATLRVSMHCLLGAGVGLGSAIIGAWAMQ